MDPSLQIFNLYLNMIFFIGSSRSTSTLFFILFGILRVTAMRLMIIQVRWESQLMQH